MLTRNVEKSGHDWIRNSHPGVQRHHLGVVNDSPDRRVEICPHARQILTHENRHKNPTTMRTRNVEKSGGD